MSREELTEGQRRRLYATFVYIDELLDEVERRLATSGAQRPFLPYVADATPVQSKIIRDYAARVRETMLAALRQHGVAPPTPDISAVWAARSSLRSAGIAATELAPRYMRGYGELSDELARSLNLTSAALTDLLDRMDSYLARGAGRELHERLQRIDAARDGQRILAELERVITAHGLIELRSALEALIERMESDTLEIAVFGRVSSGKSSLLNYILGQELLPVGVTPVTAVPTRIVYGPKPWGTAWLVDAQTETFDLGRLAEFANEHQNPGNVRHVARLQIALPHPLLRGVTLVDTPGLGSLATAGAAETQAYLPRCDVGVVLIDAASTLTPEDTALVDALARAGAQVMVLMTKADLLSAQDVVSAESYIQHELFVGTGLHIPVHGISVKPGAAARCDAWIETTLRPCLREHQRFRAQSTARKIDGLRSDVIASLERRLAAMRRDRGAPSDESADRGGAKAVAALQEALAAFDRQRLESAVPFPDPDGAAVQVLAQAAHNAAVIWREDFTASFEATPMLVASLEGRAGAATAVVQRDVSAARARLANALATAASAAPELQIEADELSPLAALPALNAAAVIPAVVATRPALLPPLRALIARHLRRHFAQIGLRPAVAAALANHDRLLKAWRIETLDALRREFIAAADRIAARLGATDGMAAPAQADALQEDLQRVRALGNQEAPHEPALAAQ